MIRLGRSYRFDYPAEFRTLPEYAARAGQAVTVLRRIPDAEADAGEVEAMYRVRALDGWEGDAFESELADAERRERGQVGGARSAVGFGMSRAYKRRSRACPVCGRKTVQPKPRGFWIDQPHVCRWRHLHTTDAERRECGRGGAP